MTTVATTIERTRRDLLAGRRTQINVLLSSLAADATITTVPFLLGLDGIAGGTIICIGTEIMLVTDTNRGAKTTTVIRAMFGSTLATHNPGDQVEIGSRFNRAQIFDTMLEELLSWPPTVFRIGATNLTYVDTTRGYDLVGVPADFYDVLTVIRAPDILTGEISNSSWPRVPFRVERNMDLGAFPSGNAIFIENFHRTGVTLRVIYNRAFATSPWTEATDLENDVGLTTSMIDTLRYGTMWRLQSTGDIPRTDAGVQSEPRNDQATPVMAATQSAAALLRIRDRRIADEELRLRTRWQLGQW